MGGKQAVNNLEETLLRFPEAAEKLNKTECEQKYLEDLEERKTAVADAEKLPDTDAKKPAELKKVKDALEKFEREKVAFKKSFFENRRDGLRRGVVSALAKPFAADKSSDVELTAVEFTTSNK